VLTSRKNAWKKKMFIFLLRYYVNCVSTTLTVLILHNDESVCFFYSNLVYRAALYRTCFLSFSGIPAFWGPRKFVEKLYTPAIRIFSVFWFIRFPTMGHKYPLPCPRNMILYLLWLLKCFLFFRPPINLKLTWNTGYLSFIILYNLMIMWLNNTRLIAMSLTNTSVIL